MGSPVVPPPGYKPDVKPPVGYAVDTSAPLSPDLEDRRTSTIGTKIAALKDDAQQEWTAIKREPWFAPPVTAPPPLDTSFYNPAKDAYGQNPPPPISKTPAAPPSLVSLPQKTTLPQPITFDTGPLRGKPVPDIIRQGNVDVNHRPGILNADGSHSSIFSMTIPVNKDGSVWKGRYEKAPAYALVPSIANGKFLTPDGKIPAKGDKKAMQQLEDAATAYYDKTREQLGVFKSSQAADRYASKTHAYTNDGTDKKVYTPSY